MIHSFVGLTDRSMCIIFPLSLHNGINWTYDTHPKEDGGSHHRGEREWQNVIDNGELSSGDHFDCFFRFSFYRECNLWFERMAKQWPNVVLVFESASNCRDFSHCSTIKRRKKISHQQIEKIFGRVRHTFLRAQASTKCTRDNIISVIHSDTSCVLGVRNFWQSQRTVIAYFCWNVAPHIYDALLRTSSAVQRTFF